jgi:predicted porin
MKKSLVALAVAGAFSGAAFAQSSVTLFGIVDTNVQYVKGDGNGSIKRLGNSGINSSRLGFRGTEDLGGGVKANFWIEGGINTDDGTGVANASTNNQNNNPAGTFTGQQSAALADRQGFTFGRRMFVGLSGGFGELRLGREYTPIFFQITSNDPFGTNGSGDTKIYAGTGLGPTGTVGAINSIAVRASNSVNYLLPSGIGGVYGHFMYAFGENPSTASNKNDGTYYGARVGWAGGPVNVSGAYGRLKLLQSATQGDYTVLGVGGTLTFGPVKPMFQYVQHKVDVSTGTDPKRTDILVGGLFTVGAGEIRASYNRYDIDQPAGTTQDAQQIALGYVHNLSRRTALYGTFAQMDNKSTGTAFSNGRATTTPGGKTTGAEIGIRHTF